MKAATCAAEQKAVAGRDADEKKGVNEAKTDAEKATVKKTADDARAKAKTDADEAGAAAKKTVDSFKRAGPAPSPPRRPRTPAGCMGWTGDRPRSSSCTAIADSRRPGRTRPPGLAAREKQGRGASGARPVWATAPAPRRSGPRRSAPTP